MRAIQMTITMKYDPERKEYRIDVAYPDGYNGLAFYADPDLMADYAEMCIEEFITTSEEMVE